MDVYRRVAFGAQATHQNIGLGVHVGLLFGNLAAFDQQLDVRMVDRAPHELARMVVVYPRVASMGPVAVAGRIDQESRNRAVRFFFRRYGGEPDHHVGLARDLHQHAGCIVDVGRITLEQLFGRHHHLVRGFAATTAATHAIGNDRQHATVGARMVQQGDAILLVVAVTLVNAGGSGESVSLGHF